MWKTKQNNTLKEKDYTKKRNNTPSKKRLCQLETLSFLHFVHPILVSCRLNFCVESTHLGIQTQPWPVWCLIQWGNRLSPLDPSGHSVPGQARIDACPACDVDSQVRMHNRSSNQAISLFPQTVYCWGSQCFLGAIWTCRDPDFFLETDTSHGSKPCEKKNT